jgi:ribosomal protein S18 acetylase RimI-like enzyme
MLITRRARPVDRQELLTLIEEFYALDRHAFDVDEVSQGLEPLLHDDRFGQVWIIGEDAQRADGYAVVTWSWSLESGGRDCILDELYVRPRNRGLGSSALAEVTVAAIAAGARAMFLETEADNRRVRAFYERCGFTIERSVWMRKTLDPQ